MDIVSNIINIVLTALMGYVVFMLQKHTDSKSLYKQALRVLLREDIESRYEKYRTREYLSREEFSDFNEMCEVYFALNGNGTGKRMYEEIKQKPIRR